jgi:integrase
VRDFLLLLLFTGLRKSEAIQLTWNRVDLKNRLITIKDTKNHADHVLPLTDFLYDMLQRRHAEAVTPYVFPNEMATGCLVEPKKQMKRVIDASGVEFTLHDLRRTFITIAESLDIPAYALKKLLNHKMTNDVTAGYIVADVERLRVPMQKITDYILKCVGVMESAPVVPIHQNATA